MDFKTLLGFECSILDGSVFPSTIKHPGSGCAVFMNRSVDADMVTGYFYCSIVYTDIASELIIINMYGDGIMAVIKADFENWIV